MASHMIDSFLFQDVFSTKRMREIWDDKSIVQNWLTVEAALAEAQAKLGIISWEYATEIVEKARVEKLDFSKIRKDMNHTGHPIVPILLELQRNCEGNAGEYIHLGATTQDIIDTGMILSAQKSFAVLYEDLYEIEDILINLADEYKSTVMAGRTNGQQALPITFGYKVAIWASEIHRQLERMIECKARDFVGQLGGGVGTLAGYGERALELQEDVMYRLGLKVPDVSWQSSRDRLMSIVNILGLISATFGKIANEIVNLQKTEVSELAEPWTQGVIGSSTMPHKRNPHISEDIFTLAQLVKGSIFTMYEAQFQEHERDCACWKIEWVTIPEIFIFTGAILDKAKMVLKGIVVNKHKMEQNLDLLGGLLLSEAVMLQLGKKIGKQTAHELIYEISMKTIEESGYFKENLLKDSRVNQFFTAEEMEKILNPKEYIGFSQYFTEKIIEKIQKTHNNKNRKTKPDFSKLDRENR
jgi:adenylosuccinate lyase